MHPDRPDARSGSIARSPRRSATWRPTAARRWPDPDRDRPTYHRHLHARRHVRHRRGLARRDPDGVAIVVLKGRDRRPMNVPPPYAPGVRGASRFGAGELHHVARLGPVARWASPPRCLHRRPRHALGLPSVTRPRHECKPSPIAHVALDSRTGPGVGIDIFFRRSVSQRDLQTSARAPTWGSGSRPRTATRGR